MLPFFITMLPLFFYDGNVVHASLICSFLPCLCNLHCCAYHKNKVIDFFYTAVFFVFLTKKLSTHNLCTVVHLPLIVHCWKLSLLSQVKINIKKKLQPRALFVWLYKWTQNKSQICVKCIHSENLSKSIEPSVVLHTFFQSKSKTHDFHISLRSFSLPWTRAQKKNLLLCLVRRKKMP